MLDTNDTVAKSTPDGAATDDKQPVTVATTPDTDDFADINHAGERRRLGDVLIENARLSALIEGKEEVITTLKSHDDHMREELKDSKSLINKLSGDVARIATQMLSAMQAIGTAGKSYSLPSDADEVTMTRRTVPPKSPEDH